VRDGRISLPGVREETSSSTPSQSVIRTHAICENKVLDFQVVYVFRITCAMNRDDTHNLRGWFLKAVRQHWPVATGSLSLRKGPCIRQNCQACASGRGHSSYALYGRYRGRRFSIYVPEELVPQVHAAIQNGRQLQELINEAGVRYVRALKKRRSRKPRR